MSDNSAIGWTEATWNPTTGCDKVSPGCGLPRFEGDSSGGCYAMALAKRLKAMGNPKYQNDGKPPLSGPGFGVTLHPEAMSIPFRWRKPRRVFVDSMADLFHEGVPDGFIAWAWDVMGQNQQHTFQVLTKRHARMRSFAKRWADLSSEGAPQLVRGPEATAAAHPSGRGQLFAAMLREMGTPPEGCAYPTFDWMEGQRWWFPDLFNVWMGVSAENQKWADIRIPSLLDTPAAVRFISAEPLLGPVDLSAWLGQMWKCGSCGFIQGQHTGSAHCFNCKARNWPLPVLCLDWVIVGGESGPGHRPMNIGWLESIVTQCKDAGVPVFVKQDSGPRAGQQGRIPDDLWIHEFPQTFVGAAA